MEPCFLVSLDLDSFLLLDPDPDPYGYHNKDLYKSAFQSLILNINVLMFSWVFTQIINKPAREGSQAPTKMGRNPFWILKTVFRLWLRNPGGDITWTIILVIPWYQSKVIIPFVYPGSATLQKQDVTRLTSLFSNMDPSLFSNMDPYSSLLGSIANPLHLRVDPDPYLWLIQSREIQKHGDPDSVRSTAFRPGFPKSNQSIGQNLNLNCNKPNKIVDNKVFQRLVVQLAQR